MDATRGPALVYLAGIGNSGPGHWQAIWHARVPGGLWVEHSSWDAPVRDVWVREFDQALRAVEGPVILVAHSLGCTLVTEWAAQHKNDDVAGAFLVAVPDVHGPDFPAQAVGFDAPKHRRLPFRTVVVASDDDPYGSPGHAAEVAAAIGAELVPIGRKGHINADSGLGDWPEGWALLTGSFPGFTGAFPG
ncbi:alpha/beta fold hydrolase [Sphaerisporangium sp. NPDC005288]|uniref:RBBP9/YdeN family alpha/beta hydrolase n=1 Tax=Sphaerisporangium sp. NPDC005288 TaxID=3155114 RepID=UPI0033AA38EF